MGLTLADILSFIDSKKRVLGSNLSDLAQNPKGAIQGLLSGALEDVGGQARGLLQDAQTARKSAIPELRQEAINRSTEGLLGIGGLGGVMTYHGTPHQFSKYDLSKIGTGEGAQAYGHGIYFAESPTVAKTYQGSVSAMRGKEKPMVDGRPINWDDPTETAAFELSRHNGDRKAAADFFEQTFKKSDVPAILRSGKPLPKVEFPGQLYHQDLPDSVLPRMLQWDRPLSEQPESVRKQLTPIVQKSIDMEFTTLKDVHKATGADVMSALQDQATGWKAASGIPYGKEQAMAAQKLRELGIPGLSYLDQGSRGNGSILQKFSTEKEAQAYAKKAGGTTVAQPRPDGWVVVGEPRRTMNHVVWDQGLLDQMVPQPYVAP